MTRQREREISEQREKENPKDLPRGRERRERPLETDETDRQTDRQDRD